MPLGPIDVNTISQQIDDCITEYCNRYNIDIYNYNFRSSLKHNEVNNIFRYCYNNLFKPDIKQFCNKQSIIDYDDIEQLNILACKFIDVCCFFNKSLGLASFGLFTGIDPFTLQLWISPEGKRANPKRFELCNAIRENNKNLLVSHLKDSTLGSVAVANNDVETGLQWQQNQRQALGVNAVYILPSERIQALKLEQKKSDNE